ncbi:MAG: ABC transporter transmembrane domain-containing protein [Cohaesibacter sp.]|nr:ABC transporter transmembrane domain-containing protein [Cohaesibacter sp.]
MSETRKPTIHINRPKSAKKPSEKITDHQTDGQSTEAQNGDTKDAVTKQNSVMRLAQGDANLDDLQQIADLQKTGQQKSQEPLPPRSEAEFAAFQQAAGKQEDYQAYVQDLAAEDQLASALNEADFKPGMASSWPGIDYDSSAGRCLQILLTSLGWGGEGRHLVQALPHFDKVSDLTAVRAVLARLNMTTYREETSVARLTADKLPCLHIDEASQVSVLLDIDPISGQITRFNGYTGEQELWPAPSEPQILYHVKKLDLDSLNKKIQSFGWVTQAISSFRNLFMSLFMINFGINMAALAVPIFIMSVYGYVIPSKALDSLAMFVIGITMVIGADFALRLLRSKVMAYIGARFDTALSVEVFQHLLYMPFTMVHNAPIGAQLARLRQFEKLRELFLGSLGTAILDLPFVIIFIVAIAIIGGWLAAIPALLVISYTIMGLISLPIAKRQTIQSGEAKTKKQNIMMELFLMQRDIRNVGGEKIWQQRFDEAAAEFAALDFRSNHFSQKIQTISQSLSMLAGLLTLGCGTLAVMSGNLSIGGLIAIMALIWRVLSPLQNTFLSLSRIGKLFEAIRMINVLMKMPIESQPGEVPNISRAFRGDISIKNVSFRYPKATDGSIKGANLSIKAGEIVAITGPSGGGKSTFLKLLAGLYRPNVGSVNFDDLDIRQIELGELRREVSYQPDHPTFLYGTVVQNFQLNDPAINQADIEAKMADLGLELNDAYLPEGLQTRLKTDTVNNMPDQLKQELLLLRTFAKKAAYYFLDEPANYLDFATDRKLMDQMASLRGQSTILFTTQRPSHMKMADRIIVLHEGQVIMNGSPEEVMPQLDMFNKMAV